MKPAADALTKRTVRADHVTNSNTKPYLEKPVKKTILLIAAMSLVAACGGKQSRGNGDTAWGHAFDAVPATATFVYAADMNELDAAMLEMQVTGPSAGALDDAIQMPSMVDFLSEIANRDIDSVEELRSLGVDLQGDYAVFAAGDALFAVMRSDDTDAARRTLSDMRSGAADQEWREHRVAGATFHTTNEIEGGDHGGRIDMGVAGNYIIFRLSEIAGDEEVAAELAGIMAGSLDDVGFTETEAGRALHGGAAAGEALSGIFYIETDTFSSLIRMIAEGRDEFMAAAGPMGLTEGSTAYHSADHERRCLIEAERLTTMFPGIQSGTYRSGDRGANSRQATTFATSPAGNERISRLFRGTIPDFETVAGSAVFAGTTAMNFQAMFDAIVAEPDLVECPNIAVLTGALAQLKVAQRDNLAFNLRTVSGDLGLAIFNAEMLGFIPNIEAAVMIGSPEAAALARRLDRAIRGQLNMPGQMVEGAEFPTSEYAIEYTPIVIRIIEFSDRVVLTVGEVPADALAALGTSPTSTNSGEIGRLSLDGDRLRGVIDQVIAYLTDTRALPDDQMEALQNTVRQFRAINDLQGTGRIDNDGLHLEFTTELNADVLLGNE